MVHVAKIAMPEQRNLASLMRFAKELDYYANHDRLVFDFNDMPFTSPYGMLFISSKIKHFRKSNPKVEIYCEGYRGREYLAHMGFFKMFGWDFGRDVGEAWGSENYLPITCLDRDSFYKNPQDRYQEIQDLIQIKAEELARLVTRNGEGSEDIFDALSFSIREMMRNVFEHSDSDKLYYCAQYWPASNKVEFAVADFGIGIRKSLGENPNFRFNSDKEAIEYSLLPSVSGKTHLRRISENWFNSGYGLYMINRLARNGGNFVIASGATGVLLSRATKTNFETSFHGTVVRFNMDVSKIYNVQGMLNGFRKEAAEIAKTIKGSGNRPPSAMSLLIRRDYRN